MTTWNDLDPCLYYDLLMSCYEKTLSRGSISNRILFK